MNTPILSDEKQTHLAHVILTSVTDMSEAKMIGDSAHALREVKRVLAEQIEDVEGSLLAIEGPEGSTLVSGRNKAALEVLRKQIAGGKKKIAIFYGAAHMSDFQRRLREEFHLAPSSTRWLAAWKMESPGQ